VGHLADRPGFYLLTLSSAIGAARSSARTPSTRPRQGQLGRPAARLPPRRVVAARSSSGIAFATILAVVAGLTITASASFAHDIYKPRSSSAARSARTQRSRSPVASPRSSSASSRSSAACSPRPEHRLPRGPGLRGRGEANLPTILYSLFWKGFNTRARLWSIYGGLISSIGLIIFSPVVSGKPASPPSSPTAPRRC
jgi:cation/acetate symporter